jgi:hypothetical protein
MQRKKKKRVYQDQTGIWCTLKKYKRKSTDYYTEEDYFQAEYLIYNNLPFLSSTERTPRQVPKELLLEGEEYTLIPNIPDNYILTTKYRIINLKNKKVAKPFMSHLYHYTILVNKQINFKKLYEENGWEYNFEEIVPLYEEHNWPFLDYRQKHAPRGSRVVTESV